MFIYIDESICLHFDEITNMALSNLAVAHREGKHFIFGKITTLKYIIEHADIHERERSIYKMILVKHPQIAGLVATLSVYILVTGPALVAQRFEQAQQTVIRIQINNFRNSSSTEPVKIICEDLSDAKFYVFLAKAYASSKNMPTNLKYFNVHGGGNLTGPTYKTYQDANNITLCIVDSDIKGEGCGMGDTAKIVIANNDDNKILSSYYVINIHEAENMIPMKILELACETPEHNSSFDTIERNIGNDFTKYIDYKKQLMISCISNHSKQCYKDYWNNKLHLLIDNNQKIIPNDILFQGFGESVLSRSIKIIASKSLKKLAEDCNSIIHQEEWENISKQIIAWGFAPVSISA